VNKNIFDFAYFKKTFFVASNLDKEVHSDLGFVRRKYKEKRKFAPTFTKNAPHICHQVSEVIWISLKKKIR